MMNTKPEMVMMLELPDLEAPVPVEVSSKIVAATRLGVQMLYGPKSVKGTNWRKQLRAACKSKDPDGSGKLFEKICIAVKEGAVCFPEVRTVQ